VIFKHSGNATPFRERLIDADEGGLLSDIGIALSAISAIVVGAVSWSLSLLLLSSGVGSIDGSLAPTLLLFLAPIVVVIFPTIMKLLFRSSTTAAIWLFALAPALGGLNVALDIFVIDSLGDGERVSIEAIQWLFIVAWLLPPLLAFSNSAWKKRKG
jgi:hypothetical protein